MMGPRWKIETPPDQSFQKRFVYDPFTPIPLGISQDKRAKSY
jgi:hypothetical protein